MKKIGLLIAFLAIISCKEEAKIDYAIVSGKITNKKADNITLSNSNRGVNKTIKVLEDGSFIDTLSIKEGTYILNDGKNRANLYINNGDNIKVRYNANDFDNTLSFSGTGSEISNYLLSKVKVVKDLMGQGTEVYLLDEAVYKAKMTEIKKASDQLLDDAKEISDDFKVKGKKYNNYAYLANIEKYQLYHSHYAKLKDFKVSGDFLNELQGMDYNNEEDFVASPDYKNLVTNYYTHKGDELAEKDTILNEIAFLKTVGEISNETIKNELIYNGSKNNITYTDDLENFYNEFKSVSTNEEHIKEITESYNKLKTVAKGQPSPKFVGYENFAGGTTSLDDLKGKFVYVDVWATWCGPCKAEIPALKEVEAKYHGKNIEFVSISVDAEKAHDKWRKMIEDDELKGIQLFADKSWNSDFVNGYLIKGIPRFILIDPNGNIVSSNAPRPSSPKLIEMFDENKI
jgi:thiol-disulfide isomerase/thioredoxin